MLTPEESIKGLLEALKVSPDNIPLRKHLADLLMKTRKFDEAAFQFSEGLKYSPDDTSLKLGLAEAYYKGGKHSAAFVIIEELMQNQKAPAAAFLLHARLLLNNGEGEFAVKAYQQALEKDPQLKDANLEARLRPFFDDSEPDFGDKVPVEYPDNDDYFTELERPEISFENVGGMEAIKDEIRFKILHPIQHPELYEAYGKKIGGGILMYGPPGCGKTLLARATAGEVDAGFISVGINDILDMWIGNSEKNLHAVFQEARENTPCVLFFDEVDALGASRTDMKKSGGRHLINQFLSELDGVQYNNDGVLILAATNTPWNMDSAFRRPGRFDRILFVPPPDESAREAILQILLQDKPAENINISKVAKKTEGFSGADLSALIDFAVESKLRESMKLNKVIPLETRDLLQARSMIRPTTKEWFNTARNYALYSNDSGLYDEILEYLNIKK